MNVTFIDPHEVPTIPGTEGWERLYPYHYLFSRQDPKRAAFESNQIWFYDSLHYPDPHHPFDLIWDEAWFLALSQYNTRHYLMPSSLGIDHRIVNGYVYVSPVCLSDPEKIQSRVPYFVERAGYYYENWDRLYENWRKKIAQVIEELEGMNFTDLPEMEDVSVIKNGIGKGSGFDLLKKYDDIINLGLLCWQYHFEFLTLAYAAQVSFVKTVDQIFPKIPIPALIKMSASIESIVCRPEKELVKLANLAIDLAIDEVFVRFKNAADVISEMGKSQAGQTWLKELEQSRYPWFYISSNTGWHHTHLSWNDNLDIPFEIIGANIKSIKSGKKLERSTNLIEQERDSIANEYRKLIRNEKDRVAFDQSLALARMVLPYSEDHTFYVEHWFHSIFWRKIRELGKVLERAGFLENGEQDIWLLKRDEVKQALWDYTTAWATGVSPRGPTYWPSEVAWRKEIHEKFRTWTPPPALGKAPETITEPFTIVLWGVTKEGLKNWSEAEKRADDVSSNVIQGMPGASGIAEGRARVLKSIDDLADINEGEILVVATTTASWVQAFFKIAGVVTDIGGPMSHAAVICREYGLPTVVGTGKGTQLIKTNDLIRINGNTGQVTILERNN